MKPENVLKLASLASTSNEEAKRAEAHARASKVYAKQIAKEANAAGSMALEMLQLAKESLCELIKDFNISSDGDISTEVLESFMNCSKETNPIVDAPMLKAILDHDYHERTDESQRSVWQALQMNEQQIVKMHDTPAISRPTTSYAEDEVTNFDHSFDVPQEENSVTLFSRSRGYVMNAARPGPKSTFTTSPVPVQTHGYFSSKSERFRSTNSSKAVIRSSALPPVLVNHQQSLYPATTKRKPKRANKSRAVGLPSPLLSMEEVTIVKRSTSPNASQHSGIIGTQHKYAVRRKYSVTSQHSVTDDEDRPPSPLASAKKIAPDLPVKEADCNDYTDTDDNKS